MRNKNRELAHSRSLAEEIFQGGEDRRLTLSKLFKGSLIMTAAPAIIIGIFVINKYIDLEYGLFLFGCIFLLSLLLIYPYLGDLQELTKYVKKLSINSTPEKPSLSFLNNVAELSDSIDNLNASWEEKNKNLSAFLEEDRILLDSLPNIIVMLDREIKPIAINSFALNVFGRKYRSHIENILNLPDVNEACKDAMKNETSHQIMIEYDEPKRTYFSLKFERFPSDSPSGIALLVVMNDLTQEKKAQEMLEDFVANASHEMKTPLASVKGFVETLLESEVDPENSKKFLTIAKEQSERLEKLISDLLTLSVVQSGRKLKYEELKIQTMLNNCVSALSNMAKEKKIKVTLKENKKLNNAFGNSDEIARVFDNLLSNAIKYSPDEATVDIEIKNIKSKHGDELIKISFIDSGEGIAEENIPRLTERFYRVDKARSRNVGGSGIGLSIVNHIIENHGGQFEIESELGKGSNFSVTLPIYET